MQIVSGVDVVSVRVGEHHHRNEPQTRVAFDRREQFAAVEVRQVEIEDDEVGPVAVHVRRFAAQAAKRFGSVVEDLKIHRPAVGADGPAEQMHVRRGGLYQEKIGASVCHRLVRPPRECMIENIMLEARTLPVTVIRIQGNARSNADDVLAVEEPLEIRLGVVEGSITRFHPISITMRTPGSDPELAAGFLYTEGIVSCAEDIASIDAHGPLSGDAGARNITVVNLAPGVSPDLRKLQRNFYTTSSCGVCGKASLDAVRVGSIRSRPTTGTRVSIDAMHRLPHRLRADQSDFALTGGLHAAALFDAAGEMLAVQEDVGRHNALDKLIGRRLLDREPLRDVVLVSSRASFELVQKAVVAGVPVLAAVGAPTSLAVELAQEFDLTLIGFLRDGRFNVYSGEHRLTD